LSTIFAYLGTRYELYRRERRWPEAAFWTSAKAHNMIEARNMVQR
jgi:hypothetical protein